MRASKAIAAILAIGIGGGAAWSLSHGLDPQKDAVNPCKDTRLSYADQGKCDSEAQAADKETRGDIYARYQAKAEAVASAPTDVGPAPTKMWTPGKAAPKRQL